MRAQPTRSLLMLLALLGVLTAGEAVASPALARSPAFVHPLRVVVAADRRAQRLELPPATQATCATSRPVPEREPGRLRIAIRHRSRAPPWV